MQKYAKNQRVATLALMTTRIGVSNPDLQGRFRSVAQSGGGGVKAAMVLFRWAVWNPRAEAQNEPKEDPECLTTLTCAYGSFPK